MQGNEVVRTSTEMIAYYENLLDRFPIVSIEDGLEEEDWEGWTEMHWFLTIPNLVLKMKE